MANLRWYDKDRYLSAFMTLLENLPEDVQTGVALDVLDEIPKIINSDCDKFMELVENHDPKKYQRWYDQNENLHKVFEAIRQLNETERESLYVSISNIMQQNTELNLVNLKIKGNE